MNVLDRPADGLTGQVATAPSPLAAKTRPQVLVVDDDTLRCIVQRNLDARGYRVSAARTAEEAVAAALHDRPRCWRRWSGSPAIT